MRTTILTTTGFEEVERPVPTPGPHDVVVAPLAVGVCEGDTFVHRSRHEAAVEPVVLGHEATGLVTAVGAEVDDLEVGMRVATLATGAFAERVLVPADLAVPVAPHVPTIGALGEPIACCVHALGRVDLAPGRTVAVVGCGFMGLVCVALARAAGAHVVALEPLPTRREAARTMGADEVVDPGAMSPAQLRDLVGPRDLVIEAAGNQRALDAATALTTEHGELLIVAYHQADGGQRTVPMQVWNLRALTVVNGHVRDMRQKAEALRQAMDSVASGRLDVTPLVTTWPVEQVEEAVRASIDHPDQVIKPVVTFPAP